MNDLEKRAISIKENADLLQVINNESYENAGEFLKSIKTLRKLIDDSFNPIIKKSHDAHKEAIAQKKKHTTPLDIAESCIKQKIGIYIHKCEMKRREREKKLQAEMKERQEKEAMEKAKELEANGDKEGANEILNNVIDSNPTVVLPKIESKIEGVSTRKTWKFKIIDPKKITSQFLIPDLKKITAFVKASGKEAESIVCGIEVFEDNVTYVRVP